MKWYIIFIGVLVVGLIVGAIYMNKQGIRIQDLLGTKVLGIISAAAVSIEMQIAANADDGGETGAAWYVAGHPTYNPDMEFGNYAGGVPYDGFRFQLDIPQGATITAAYMSHYGGFGITGSPVLLKIYADNVDNSAAWSTAARPSLRAATTAQIDWDLTSWTDAGWNNSTSILSVIQEIVNRSGWAANNYIGLIIKDDGSVSGRSVWGSDYSGGASFAAKLYINYTTATDTQSPQWSSNSTNSTLAGTLINHTVVWTDNVALSNFTFSFDNGTGTFVNDSSVSMTGTSNQSWAVKVVNSTIGSYIRWRIWAYDLTGNGNVTSIFAYNTTTTSPTNCWTVSSGKVVIPSTCRFELNTKGEFQ
jgi:hypothetical protein